MEGCVVLEWIAGIMKFGNDFFRDLLCNEKAAAFNVE